MNALKTVLARIALATAALFAAYSLLLCMPQPFFAYSVRAGYADYVGKGTSFNYDEARRAFLAGVPEMDWQKSGLYWRFHLLVANLLDHRRWSVARLLRDPPPQEAVEAAVREEKP